MRDSYNDRSTHMDIDDLIYYRPRKLRIHRTAWTNGSEIKCRFVDKVLIDDDLSVKEKRTIVYSLLKSIPQRERGVEWTERVVCYYCLRRVNAARVRSLRKDIISYWQNQEQYDRASQFDLLIGKIRSNSQAFFINFGNSDIKSLSSTLKDNITLFEQTGYDFFLNSGTLLGAVRNGKFISFDDDIDIGVVLNASNGIGAAREFMDLYKRLVRIDAIMVKPSFHSPVIKVELANKVIIDIFPSWIKDDKLFVWPHTFGDIEQNEFLPLSSITLEGVRFNCPQNPELMLERNYGSTWKTPDPEFKFPWKVARKQFRVLLLWYWIFLRIHWLTRLFSRGV